MAASISKSDLCSEIVGEYPELQGTMGKYFALSQGFEEDVANSISDHYNRRMTECMEGLQNLENNPCHQILLPKDIAFHFEKKNQKI